MTRGTPIPVRGEELPFLDGRVLFDLLPWADAVAAVASALLGGLDPRCCPPRAAVDVAAGQLLLMPAETASGVGVKVGSVAPGNPAGGLPRIWALYVLLDPVTLSPMALVDGTALTTLRTPAVSAVAVDHLAAPDASRLVVFGSGPQAWGHVQAIRAVRPLRAVSVVGRDPAGAERLVASVAASGLQAAVGTAQAVADADVVVCATTAREPLFDGRLLAASACTVAVGSHQPDARELDAHTFRTASRVVVEDQTVALAEAGDVVLALAEGALSRNDLTGIADAVRWRPASGRSVFKSVGMGWEDLVVASAAHDRWRERVHG